MRRLTTLLLLMLAVPTLAFAVAHGLLSRHEQVWQDALARQRTDLATVAHAHATLAWACAQPGFRGADPRLCAFDRGLGLMRAGAVATAGAGLVWLGLIALAGRCARRNRALLLAVFGPGLRLTIVFLVALVATQAALAMAALYLLEASLVQRVHAALLAGVGAAAAVGIAHLARASLTVVQAATTSVVGRRLSEEDHPAVWQFVRETARRTRVVPPHHVVAGLEANFFVTESPVQMPEETLRGRTMFLSLSLARILAADELRAIVAHELGHYRERDTTWSRTFYPVYRGTSEALDRLGRQAGGIGAVVLLPTVALLGFFLDCFAAAERAISRDRELTADRLAAEVAGAVTTATALVKVHAFAGHWYRLQPELTGLAAANASRLFAERVADHAGPQVLAGLADRRLAHPTDSHPPLAQRLDNLGVPLAQVSAAALEVEPAAPAVSLLRDHETVERALTAAERAWRAPEPGVGAAAPSAPRPVAVRV
jgi:Zn-dependent protease with chaperone function